MPATPPDGGKFNLIQPIGLHGYISKTTIVDDCWSIIGSANCTRRSLYSDLELAISFIGNSGFPHRVNPVQQYRINLWGNALEIPIDKRSWLADINEALNIWEPSWGVGVAGSGVLPADHPH